jgi:hypothetical protein
MRNLFGRLPVEVRTAFSVIKSKPVLCPFKKNLRCSLRIHATSSAFGNLILHLAFQFKLVKLLITNNAFCIVQRATAQSKIGTFFMIMVQLKLLRFVKPAGLTVRIFSLSLFVSVAYLELSRALLYY